MSFPNSTVETEGSREAVALTTYQKQTCEIEHTEESDTRYARLWMVKISDTEASVTVHDRIDIMAHIAHEKVVGAPDGLHRTTSRYLSFTSSLSPLLPEHDATPQDDIVDQCLEDSTTTQGFSESKSMTPAVVSPWDPISDISNHANLSNHDTVEQDHTFGVSSPSTKDCQVTAVACDTKSTLSRETRKCLRDDSTSMTKSTVYSAESSRSAWDSVSVSSIRLDDSLEPLLRRAFCMRIAESMEESKNKLTGDREIASQSEFESSTTSVLDMGRVKAGPLPSSTLFGRALQYSPRNTSRIDTATSSSRPLAKNEQRSILGRSTEDMIRFIYGHRSSDRPDSYLPFHNQIEHNHEQFRQSNSQSPVGQLGSRRKSVQGQDQEFDHAREDEMSDILDAYLDHGLDANEQKESARLVRLQKAVAPNHSARDREKAAAKIIFRATPDWQNLDKISSFLRATKDLSHDKHE